MYVKFSYAYQFTYQNSGWIFKISICNSQNGQEGGTASLCQILSKSLQPWPRYSDFSIFQDGVMASAAIWIVKIGNFQRSERSRGSNCLTMPNSSKSLQPRPRYGDFAIFQDGGRRHVGFLKFQFLTVEKVKKVEMHQYAKFHRNRCNRGRDM